jgi:hypothetical protein
LFATASILPVQFVPSPTLGWLGRLCLAVLADALGCLEGKGSRGGTDYRREATRRARKALDWLEAQGNFRGWQDGDGWNVGQIGRSLVYSGPTLLDAITKARKGERRAKFKCD